MASSAFVKNVSFLRNEVLGFLRESSHGSAEDAGNITTWTAS